MVALIGNSFRGDRRQWRGFSNTQVKATNRTAVLNSGRRFLRLELSSGRGRLTARHALTLALFDLRFVPIANFVDAHGLGQNAGLGPPIDGAVHNAVALL
jgi:hypothetical protein